MSKETEMVSSEEKGEESAILGEENGGDLEEGKAESAAPAAKITKKRDSFFEMVKLFNTLNSFFTSADGFGSFALRYIMLTLIQLSFVFSVLIGTYVVPIKLDELNGKNFYVLVGCCAGTYVAAQIAKPFKEGLMMWYRGLGSTTLSTAMIAKIFDLPLGSITTTPTGEFVQLIAGNWKMLESIIPGFYGVFIPVCVETFILFIFLSATYKYTGLVILALFFAFSVMGYVTAGRAASRSQNELKNGMALFGKLTNYMNSYERAHNFGNVGQTITDARDAFTTFNNSRYEDKKSELFEEVPLLVFVLVMHLAGAALVPLSMDGASLEQTVIIMMYVLGFYLAELSEFATAIGKIRSGVGDFIVTRDFLQRENAVGDRPGAVKLVPSNSPEIEFKNVVFSYGERVILDNVSFKINGGTRLGVVGSSGCGKSTIIKLLLRFYAPTSGTITVNGQDIYDITSESLRSLFSVVTQDSQLFNATIRDNIGYGKMGSNDEEILNAAKLAELTLGATDADDMHLDKECGEKGAHLSGGQQQRVALARAMLKNGLCYLLDEPTTGLDGVVARQLQDTFDEITKASSTIMITHHLEDLKNADQIIYLDEGRIIEQGTFKELVDAKGEFFSQLEARKREGRGDLDIGRQRGKEEKE